MVEVSSRDARASDERSYDDGTKEWWKGTCQDIIDSIAAEMDRVKAKLPRRSMFCSKCPAGF